MFIIWGTRTFKKIMTQTGPYTCNNCNNAVHFQLLRVATWFTLFFIPIFPVSFKYFHICPICSQGQQVKKDIAKNIMAQQQNMIELQ